MSYSRRSRYSHSPSPYKRYSRSVSRSLSRSRSRSRGRSRSASSDAENPGNNLYVTGLSLQITKKELERHFASEGMVIDVHLVVDPWTRECRGFGFVTMSTVEEADRCIKYLNRSVLEGRVITVEKAKRRRGRTPTPGRYLGLKKVHVRHWTPSYSPRRSPSYSPYRRSWSQSPGYSSERSKSYSHYYKRSYSPYSHRLRLFSSSSDSRRDSSPSSVSRRQSYSRFAHYDSARTRSCSRSCSPYRYPVRRSDRSYLSSDLKYSPDVSRSLTPPRARSSRRRGSGSVSPSPRRSPRRRYSRRFSPSPRSSGTSYSRSISPRSRKGSKQCQSHGGSFRRGHSPDCYSGKSYSPYRFPVRRSDRSYSSSDSKYSPDVSQSLTPPRARSSRRRDSGSISPSPRRSPRRRYSRSFSPSPRSSGASYSRSISPRPRKDSKERQSHGGSFRHGHSPDCHSGSRILSPSSQSVSRSVTPRSTSSL